MAYIEKGQRIIVALDNGQVFEGSSVKTTNNRIDIIDVMEHVTGKRIKDMLSFYKSEISSVRVLDQSEAKVNGVETKKPSDSPAHELPERNVIDMPRDEFDRLKDMTRNFTYMATIDSRYLSAIEYLNSCENVSVVGIGNERGRLEPISLLVLASWDSVYIFDLLLYSKKALPEDLKGILEAPEIKKVVHNSHSLVDCLWHFYKVKLNNYFDTSMADLLIQKKENNNIPEKICTLSETLAQYLNFPTTFLDAATAITSKEWTDRPLNESQKTKAAQLCAYLIKLKTKQEEVLLKDLHSITELFSKSTLQLDGFKAVKSLNKRHSVPEEVKSVLESL